MRGKEEIQDQIDATHETNYPGMTYAEGVRAALEWILGDADEPPMEG